MSSRTTKHVTSPATAAALVIAATLSGACALFQPHVRDLTFVSLKAKSAQREWSGRDYDRFSLRFTTKRNLINLGDYGAHFDIGRCPSTREPLISDSDIYYRGRSLWEYPRTTELTGEGPFEYEVFIDDPRHNLEQATGADGSLPDLCFEIYGSSYFGAGGFDSNIAVVPKEAVAAATAHGRKGASP